MVEILHIYKTCYLRILSDPLMKQFTAPFKTDFCLQSMVVKVGDLEATQLVGIQRDTM